MAQKPRKQIDNKSSSLLTREENQQIFRLVGSRCKTIATAVVQLYHTQSPNHLQWVKKDTGVLCFVRDSVKKTYFFRLFCLKRNCMIWEQETYTQMEYDCRCPFLHTFEGDKRIYAFNFASLHEAEEARQIIADKLARRLKADYKNLPQRGETALYSNHDSLQNANQKSLNIEQALKKKRRRNLTKADIGNPSEFRHVSHIGWHRDKGLDAISTDSVYQEIFKKAGIGEQDLQNRKTREFILDFIQNYSDIESIKQEAKKNKPAAPLPSTAAGAPVPPVPPRTAPKPPHNRAAPPPPPNSNQPPPRPAQYRIGVPLPPPGNAPPPPPPPLTGITNGNLSNVGAPPPPPLPPLTQESSSPEITNNQLPPMDNSQGDMRSALLQSIREGATLKPVDVVETKSNESGRDDLLKKIREGVSLKSAAEREIKAPTTPVNEVPDIAMALRKALETRSNRIHSDSDTDSDISNDDEWDA